MNENSLAQSVGAFAQRLVGLSEADLNRPWAWQSYDSEGVRFGFFRTYEELRELAARLHQQRAQSTAPLSEAQRILGQYHAAYRDLQASLLGLTPAQMDQAPAENEWPVRKILPHIIGADLGFYVLVRFALDNIRAGLVEPQRVEEEAWPRLSGLDEPAFTALMNGPFEGQLDFYTQHHQRVINDFASLGDAELDMPSYYWEDEPYPLRFRLHRFDSHLRQHTIQVDKTLAAIGAQPTETRRLLRLIYAALAEAESAMIGCEALMPEEIDAAARLITARAEEFSTPA